MNLDWLTPYYALIPLLLGVATLLLAPRPLRERGWGEGFFNRDVEIHVL
jgi:hypothetical protein